MSTVYAPRRSWQSAFVRAAFIEGVLVLLISLVFFGAMSIPAFRGADSPLFFYAVFLLQLPASLLFVPLLGLTQDLPVSDTQRLILAFVLVALAETAILALLVHKPWRKDVQRG